MEKKFYLVPRLQPSGFWAPARKTLDWSSWSMPRRLVGAIPPFLFSFPRLLLHQHPRDVLECLAMILLCDNGKDRMPLLKFTTQRAC